MLGLMPCHPALPDAPLSSYKKGGEVFVVRYDRALDCLREVVEMSGRRPMDFALHSLRIGGASTLAVGGRVLERGIQRSGRWKSDAYELYTVNNEADARTV